MTKSCEAVLASPIHLRIFFSKQVVSRYCRGPQHSARTEETWIQKTSLRRRKWRKIVVYVVVHDDLWFSLSDFTAGWYFGLSYQPCKHGEGR